MKITILHREAKRINGNFPARYSRHFYDVYKLIKLGIGEDAFNQLDMLEKVVNFKKKFYPCKWATYDEVLNGNCILIPDEVALEIFKRDYQIMEV